MPYSTRLMNVLIRCILPNVAPVSDGNLLAQSRTLHHNIAGTNAGIGLDVKPVQAAMSDRWDKYHHALLRQADHWRDDSPVDGYLHAA